MTQQFTPSKNETIIEIQCTTSTGPFRALLNLDEHSILCMPASSTQILSAQETERRAILISAIAKLGYGKNIDYEPDPRLNIPQWNYYECTFQPRLVIFRIDKLTDSHWQSSAQYIPVNPNAIEACFQLHFEESSK